MMNNLILLLIERIGRIVMNWAFGALIAVVIGGFLVKWMYAWTIGYICPGLVDEGMVAATISWANAWKLSLFAGILTGTKINRNND